MTEPTRPASPGSNTIRTTGTNPADLDPELAAMEMIKEMLKGMDSPSDITKPFAVRKAIYTALNDTDDNPTGYDASLRIRLYSTYEKASLNISAKLFNSFMAFLMKPKMIIQGLPITNQPNQEPGFFGRIINRVTGGGKPAPAPAPVQP